MMRIMTIERNCGHRRISGGEEERYEEGALRYGFGSPMLSVEVGRQVGF